METLRSVSGRSLQGEDGDSMALQNISIVSHITTQCHNPDHDKNLHFCENIKSCMLLILFRISSAGEILKKLFVVILHPKFKKKSQSCFATHCT
jgi:hypothetical protein